MLRIHNRMLRARIMKLREDKDCAKEEQAAFQLLRDGLLGVMNERKSHPTLNVYSDQIVWSRSPVRIDVAGGWTDTPPYSLYSGGSVVNLAIELNGQPPLQVYVKPCKEYHITLRSIDMGAMMAMLVLAILPIIVFYLTCQKYIIKGVAAGAVKG